MQSNRERGRSRPLIGNHVQPRPARDQSTPGSPPPYSMIAQVGEPGYEASVDPHRKWVVSLCCGMSWKSWCNSGIVCRLPSGGQSKFPWEDVGVTWPIPSGLVSGPLSKLNAGQQTWLKGRCSICIYRSDVKNNVAGGVTARSHVNFERLYYSGEVLLMIVLAWQISNWCKLCSAYVGGADGPWVTTSSCDSLLLLMVGSHSQVHMCCCYSSSTVVRNM